VARRAWPVQLITCAFEEIHHVKVRGFGAALAGSVLLSLLNLAVSLIF
jgi:uncharacterized membrane protein YvlD (DUF360 family)